MVTKEDINNAIYLLRDMRWKCVEHVHEFSDFYSDSEYVDHMSILPEYCDDTTIYMKGIGTDDHGHYMEDYHAEIEIRHLLNPEILKAKIIEEERIDLKL